MVSWLLNFSVGRGLVAAPPRDGAAVAWPNPASSAAGHKAAVDLRRPPLGRQDQFFFEFSHGLGRGGIANIDLCPPSRDGRVCRFGCIKVLNPQPMTGAESRLRPSA